MPDDQNDSQQIGAELSAVQAPEVSVIVVTMNRKEILATCLESIFSQSCDSIEIIVVDNGSSDGTVEMVNRSFPSVHCFNLTKNSGVTGGRNYGVRLAAGEICVFIDDDAIFENNDAIKRATSYFKKDRTLGCLAFRISKPQGGVEEYKSIPRADKKIIHRDYECSYFCGAGFACRRTLFIHLGMFWEPLFFIGEELDLSYRLVNQGYTICRAFSISVIHNETPSARVPGKSIYYGVRNRLLVATRNLPWLNVFSHGLLWGAYYFIAAAKSRHLLFFSQGLIDTFKDLPQAIGTRSPVTKETLAKVKRLSGRVYY